ncbi:hypothetical protein [Paraburkholderia oxyphila]|uniref:hypothetical protein n=1 Tax=Paraburkholderia oxyphila TaxID=614212 RepID=UPI000A712C5A|nr:hypothetical protein [Paraburkholderia oxyphila]
MGFLKKHAELGAHGSIAALLLIVLPLSLGAFWIGEVGKYLSFAFVAIGIVLA